MSSRAVVGIICFGMTILLSELAGAIDLASDNVLEAIKRQEEQLRAATLASDVEATNRLLAEDWLNVNANGTLTDKPQLLRVIKDFKFDLITDKEVRIRVFGDTAIVTGVSTRELTGPDGGSMKRKVRFTRVWIKQGDGWVVATAQATPVAE